MTRSRLRVTVALAGLLLVTAQWLAPRVSPAAILYLTALWIAAATSLLYAAFMVVRTWTGTLAAAGMVAALAITPIVLTAVDYSPRTTIVLPCPRNWGWLPTWQLRSSPMASVAFRVGSAQVKVCYGRLALRGRGMIGGKYVPFGRLWRTGANEPTTVISTAPLDIAGVTVPAGRVSLYTVPGPETWEIIVNGSTSQWGLESEYGDSIKARELGRAILRSEAVTPLLERLTFSVEPEVRGSRDSVGLVLRWQGTRVRIPIRFSR